MEWTKILYPNFKANTQNSCNFSGKFSINRGVHQGGPCSSLYFLICAETMAILIKEDVKIKGISVNEFLNVS